MSYTRQVDYSGELSEDIVSCINPDGSPLLTSDENDVLEAYVESMKKVWKSKDPEERKELLAEVLAEENTAAFRPIYARVLEQIKSWAPTFDSVNYKAWSADVNARVENWINIVLDGKDPKTTVATNTEKPAETSTETSANTAETTANATATTATSTATVEEDNSDLPF